MGRAYLNEQPKGSDMYTESSVAKLGDNGLDLYRSITDQCAHGAMIDEQLIKKATELWSNKDIQSFSPELGQLCRGDHTHLPLRGSNKLGALTAQAASFPKEVCRNMLKFARGVATLNPNGG